MALNCSRWRAILWKASEVVVEQPDPHIDDG